MNCFEGSFGSFIIITVLQFQLDDFQNMDTSSAVFLRFFFCFFFIFVSYSIEKTHQENSVISQTGFWSRNFLISCETQYIS